MASGDAGWWLWVYLSSMIAAALVLTAMPTAAAQSPEAPGDDGERPAIEVFAGVGRAELGSRDAKGSPLAYRGGGTPLAVGGRWQGRRWAAGLAASSLVMGFNVEPLEAASSPGAESTSQAEPVSVDLAVWGQRIQARSQWWSLALGGQISHWTFFRSYAYHPAQIGGVESWEATITADARAELAVHRGRWSARFATSVALGGRVLRPSHAIRGDEQLALVRDRRRIFSSGQWASMATLQKMGVDVALQFNPWRRVAIRSSYRLGLLSFSDEPPTRALNQQVLVGLVVGFR